MSIQMTAVVETNNIFVPAPYEAFATNTNVVAHNEFSNAMYADKEFMEVYGVTGQPTFNPEMQATSKRRQMFNTLLGISFYDEPVQIFLPEQVKELAAKLQNAKAFNLKAIDMVFNMGEEDFYSTIEFFDIAADKGYAIAFS